MPSAGAFPLAQPFHFTTKENLNRVINIVCRFQPVFALCWYDFLVRNIPVSFPIKTPDLFLRTALLRVRI